ncbi:hypothetical protein AVI51_01885 [Piscirickettsia salmonis]|uniref:tRNA uridine(34) hydroxylase n=1 Tax=Piscirickettsia salmonis TaxID=1238 RepID=A0A9Q5VHU6_PISSA|nr:rhodanese-related sulfurtransferase [Piscirickettsia salmonis]ALA24806.1 rhodanese-like domain protein [Piscirickettsia salmonis]APS45131.1 hypothetical protein AVI48_12595 [Piscirickettsia salmonis]APS48491.1 hypothetical protein AVI49_13205 [Piscirickettsia salmonis]APS49753.1 hypothetical protein AVI50_01930 [Piscirickettsia salmonis]APS52935.1 hypothetical protein AVI51_01885 [Piscirickettsia salmonis]
MNQVVVAAMYKFARLPDYKDIQPKLLAFCKAQGIKGTLLLAQEGINGTVSGSRQAIDNLLNFLKSDSRLRALEHKESYLDAAEVPFYRMRVKLKKEIVTLGVDGIDPNEIVGHYVKAQNWNALISDPDVIVVDTRNDYEYDIGTFKRAENPNTETFREFPEYVEKNLDPKKHKKVAMFCTGGIRCEKSTAYMLKQGFEEVYHLEGGILKYLEEVPKEESLWEGECFVFDNRVSVNHDLEKGQYDQCHGCRYPITEQEKASSLYIEGVSCPYCYNNLSDEQKARFSERQRQMALAKHRGHQHIGDSIELAKQVKRQKRKAQVEACQTKQK